MRLSNWLQCMAALALTLATATSASANPPASWPATESYFFPSCPDGTPADFLADAPAGINERDIVGDATHPAFGIYDDGTHVFMRTRLDATPLAVGGAAPLAQFGWGVGLDLSLIHI